MMSIAVMMLLQAQPPAGWERFTQFFDTAMAADSIVGASILVLRDGHILAHHEHGFADRARGERITPRTIYHYGSITKTLTAIAIMQLRDRGRLALDDRVTSHIPELRQVHDSYGSMDSVTIRMLLSHSAGLQGPTWPYKTGAPWEPFEPTRWEQLVAMMPYQELQFKPGSRYSYSNPGFIYLARIIEQLSGDPWETYVQKNIFDALGLTHSYFGVTPYFLAPDRSHNYTLMQDSTGRRFVHDNGADFDPGITIPNGGWNAPLSDLATYLTFLTGAMPNDAILSRTSLESMWKGRYPIETDSGTARSDSIGLSFFVLHRGASTFIGHTGGQAGFLAFIYLNPANHMAVAAAFNTANDIAATGQPRLAFERIRDAALSLLQ